MPSLRRYAAPRAAALERCLHGHLDLERGGDGAAGLASSAAFSKAAWSIPGTQPFTSSALDRTSKPPPRFGPNSTTQLVSIRRGVSTRASPCESAIEKQLACAAARAPQRHIAAPRCAPSRRGPRRGTSRSRRWSCPCPTSDRLPTLRSPGSACEALLVLRRIWCPPRASATVIGRPRSGPGEATSSRTGSPAIAGDVAHRRRLRVWRSHEVTSQDRDHAHERAGRVRQPHAGGEAAVRGAAFEKACVS